MKIRNHRPVRAALLAYGRKMGDRVRPIDNVRKLRASDANVFLIRVMFERSVDAGRAWEAGRWFNDSLGDPSDVKAVWNTLSKMKKKRLLGFLRYGYGGKAFHRHYKTFARQLPEAAKLLLDNYDGDPRKLWNNKRNIAAVRERLEDIPGIGPALSRMAVLILARNYGLLGGKKALPQLDIKPDIHVMRVFKRIGFIAPHASRSEAITTAQRLHKKFPAALDAPAFEIGRKWCRPRNPVCSECPLTNACPRLILQNN